MAPDELDAAYLRAETAERNLDDLARAARAYVKAHKLMRVRFQHASDAGEYTIAGASLEAVLARLDTKEAHDADRR